MDVQKTPFRSLLPSSISDDPQFIAAALVLDEMFADTDAQVRNVLLWSRIDELEEPLLSNLAWQLHLDGYEGYSLAETVEQKRAMIKEAIQLHFHKGTRYSLERIFELLDMGGRVIEWWEAPTDPDFKPYEFDVDVDVTRPIDESFHSKLENTIEALKNVRSHRRKFRINLNVKGQLPFIAIGVYGGATSELTPFGMEDFEVTSSVPFIAAGYQAIGTITLQPIG